MVNTSKVRRRFQTTGNSLKRLPIDKRANIFVRPQFHFPQDNFVEQEAMVSVDKTKFYSLNRNERVFLTKPKDKPKALFL